MDRLMEIKRTGEDDPDFGRVPDRPQPPAARSSDAEVDRTIPEPVARGGDRQPGLRAAVPRVRGGQGHRARRHRRRTSTRPLCSATSGSSAPRRARTTPSSRTGSDRVLREQLARGARPTTCLVPQVVYGYFPANGDGDDLVIWTRRRPHRRGGPVLTTPAQTSEPFLCIADFFRPVDSRRDRLRRVPHRHDGAPVSERTAELFAADQYQDYLLLHGLGVEMAEALAELWHRRIREEWGFADEDGPTVARPLPPAVPRWPLLVGLSGLPRPRGQHQRSPSCSTADRLGHRVQRGDRLPVPARADHHGAHLPPPPGQVLRRPLITARSGSSCSQGRGRARTGRRARRRAPAPRPPRRRAAHRPRRRPPRPSVTGVDTVGAAGPAASTRRSSSCGGCSGSSR